MKVILLAAGQSKRVSPIKDKNFIVFCGKYLIEWQLAMLIELGMTEFVIVGNKNNLKKLKEFVIDFMKFFKNGDLSINIVEQKRLSDGMAGGIMACKKHFDDGPCLVVSCNDVVDISAFKAVIEVTDSQAALLGYKVSEYFPGGYMKLGHKNRIEGIVEKPGKGKEPSDYVNIVVHSHLNYDVLYRALSDVMSNKEPRAYARGLLPSQALHSNACPAPTPEGLHPRDCAYGIKSRSDKDDKYEVALDNLIKTGMDFRMVPYDGFWQPLKFPWHILELDRHFLRKRAEELEGDADYRVVGETLIHSSAEISKRAVIKGDVIIEAGVRVCENAVIQGPAYLEDGCVVGNNALFRESFAGQKCVIGFSTEVARSHLGDSVWTHSNYIGDSVIGSNVSFGAGAVTANLRLDEGDIKWQGEPTGLCKLGIVTGDNIRVGVQTSLMPGISVGTNSMVGGGLTISENIEVNEFVYGKTTLCKRKNKTDVSKLLRS